MNRPASFLCLVVIISTALALPASAQSRAGNKSDTAQSGHSRGGREILTNESVINLVRAGFKEKTVISIILSSPVSFDVSTPKLIELKKRGVSERIVLVMMQRQELFARGAALSELNEDNFFRPEDEAFFNAPPRLRVPDDARRGSSDDDETSVFGSRSGSDSRTRSRGGINSDRSNEGEVNGSVTARIIKPRVEGGGGPKLEHAQKLTNQSIIDMVQANFSEGTIIRRIDSTHVDFDLSPTGRAELRRNRVSERIIKSMEAAMEEEQPNKNEK